MNTLALQAARCFLRRQDRTEHPEGKLDGPRWNPIGNERQACCSHVREPSRAWPWSLMTHCRTLKHICIRYGVDEKEVRKVLKTVKVVEKL